MRFVCNYPALLYKNTLIIADLHIGVEKELREKGIRVPYNNMKEELLELIEETGAGRLMILGDVKHNIPGVGVEEYMQIPKLFEELNKKVDVEIIKGNHDGGIQKILPKVKVHSACGEVYGRIALNHGHSWPTEKMMQTDALILAHTHPCIEFIDKMGHRSNVRAWVIGKLNEKNAKKRYTKINKKLRVIVLPAFNPFLGGLAFNKNECKELSGPFFENEIFELKSAEMFLLNGVRIGKIKKLQKKLSAKEI